MLLTIQKYYFLLSKSTVIYYSNMLVELITVTYKIKSKIMTFLTGSGEKSLNWLFWSSVIKLKMDYSMFSFYGGRSGAHDSISA